MKIADRTRSKQPLQGPGEQDGTALKESNGVESNLNGGSEVRSQSEQDHPAGNAAEQVIAASEQRRNSEQHRRSVDGGI